MVGKYAVLIDGGFLKQKLWEPGMPPTCERIVKFTERIGQHEFLAGYKKYRVYYYDAEPLQGEKCKPLTGGESTNFQNTPTYTSGKALLEQLKRQPYFAVRLGESSVSWLVATYTMFKLCDH